MDRKTGQLSRGGWAEFEAGQLVSSGTIEIDPSPNPTKRLTSLATIINEEFTDPYDMLVIEDIWGYIASKTLVHAAGIIIGNTNTIEAIQMNTKTWQSIALHVGGWEKSDEADAVYIGVASLVLAAGYRNKRKTSDNRDAIYKICEQNNWWGLNERGYQTNKDQTDGTEGAGGESETGDDEVAGQDV